MNRISIVNGVVLDPETGEHSEHPIHIVGDEIVALDGPVPSDARVIDAEGRLVTPGLIDCHFHALGVDLNLLRLEAMRSSYVTAGASRRLASALRRGFTTVRDVAGGDAGLAKAVDEGLFVGPRYLYAGRALTQTGGHGDARPGDLDLTCCSGHMAEVVDGVDALRVATRERLRTGSHVIKVFASGGVVSPTDPLRPCQYSADELRAVCDEAIRRGSYVAAHAYSGEAIIHAVTSGVRSIEHGNLLDDTAAEAMAAHGAFLVPTLIAYESMSRRGAQFGLSDDGLAKNRLVLEAGVDSLRTATKFGVPIAFGSDLMGELEDEQLGEFRVRSAAFSTGEMLASATTVASRLLGRPDLGSLAVGCRADAVIFDDDPFRKVQALWVSPRTVISRGELVT